MHILRTIFILSIAGSSLAFAGDYKEVSWDDLMPSDWEPMAPKELNMFDEQALENELLSGTEPDMAYDPIPSVEIAPVVSALDQQKLRIPGYVIPIKFDADSVSEFLLVPYMGACIHTPPPPGNQIVYVTLSEPMTTNELWAPVWVSGTMTTKVAMTQYVTAGYHMMDAMTEVYE